MFQIEDTIDRWYFTKELIYYTEASLDVIIIIMIFIYFSLRKYTIHGPCVYLEDNQSMYLTRFWYIISIKCPSISGNFIKYTLRLFKLQKNASFKSCLKNIFGSNF